MAYSSAVAQVSRAQPRRAHIIDVLIAERAPTLAASPAWPLLRPVLHALLGYGEARRMADAIAPLPGRAALAFVSRLLGVTARVSGLERVPPRGRLIAVCNHPTGVADGVAVHDALVGARPEMMFYANADALRVSPRFGEVLIPVEWVEAKRSRERTRLTLTLTRAAMKAERALIVFPAGRLSRRVDRRWGSRAVADLPWASSAFSVARKCGAPILPLHLAGPWPRLFHLFDGFSGELRDMTLFHELLNKRGKAFRLTVGYPVDPGALPADAAEAAAAMKRYVETVLPRDPQRPFA